MPNRRRQPMRKQDLIRGPVMPVPESKTLADLSGVVSPGQHLWIMTGMWRILRPEDVYNPDIPKYLDMENLLSIDGPGCYICEQVYTPEVAAFPCPGDPEGREY